MKYIKSRILSVACIAIAITGCTGHSNSDDMLKRYNANLAKSIGTPQNALQQALKSSLEGSQDYVLNMSNALFLNGDKDYSYIVRTPHGLITNEGSLYCQDASSCLVNLGDKLETYTNYSIEFFTTNLQESKESQKVFVGAAMFHYTSSSLKLQNLEVDSLSTSRYLYNYVSERTDTHIASIEDKLYTPVQSFKPGVPFDDIRYFYYIYLTTEKKLSHQAALDSILSIYEKCEDGDYCSLDKEFIKNELAVDRAMETYAAVMKKLLQDKNDASLAEAEKWYTENIKDKINEIFGGKDIASKGIDFLFPGVGGKVVGPAEGIKNGVFGVVDFAFGAMGLENSKQALARINLFNTNLTKVYNQAIPTMQEYSKQTADILKRSSRYVVVNDFEASTSVIHNSYNSINSELVESDTALSIKDYLHINLDIKKIPPKDAFFSWISKRGDSDGGIFDSVMTDDRRKAFLNLTSDATIDSLSEAASFVYSLDKGENINTIANAQAYNQSLTDSLLQTLDVIQENLYIDSMAITLRENDPHSSNWAGTIQLVWFGLGKDHILSGNYQEDIEKVTNFYKLKMNNTIEIYHRKMVAEKRFVSAQALQTLEVKGKCNITYTDGLNQLSATCPRYYANPESSVPKVKFIRSTLYKPNSTCATINDDASGDITTVTDIQNINGVIGCLSPEYQKQRKNFDFPNLDGDPNHMAYFAANRLIYDQEVEKSFGSDKYVRNPLVIVFGNNSPMTMNNVKINFTSASSAFGMDAFSMTFKNRLELKAEKDRYGNLIDPSPKISIYQEGTNVNGNPHWLGWLEIEKYKYKNGESILNPLQFEMPAPNVILMNNPNLNPVDDEKDILPVEKSFSDFYIDFEIPENCQVSRNKKTNAIDLGRGYRTSQYNGYIPGLLFSMACDNDATHNFTYFNRVLLPGGKYEIKDNKIFMQNHYDWEYEGAKVYNYNLLTARTDPHISVNHLHGGTKISASTNGSNIECGDVSLTKQALINQGRNEFADTYSCSQHLWSIIVNHSPTALYIPLVVNYQGFKAFTLWSNGIGNGFEKYKLSQFGLSDNSVEAYDFEKNQYVNTPINVWGYNLFDVDYNSSLGENIWIHN